MTVIRKLNLGAVALVHGRIRNDIPIASRIRDEVEALLDDEFFEAAPFEGLGLIIRYGEKTNLSPEYQRITRGELPIAVELRMDILRKAGDEKLAIIFRWALLETILAIAEKYKLPNRKLLAEQQKVNGRSQYDEIADLVSSKLIN